MPGIGRNMKQTGNSRRKIAVWGTIVLMLVLVVASTFFAAMEADHECCGDNCIICACIRTYKKNAELLGKIRIQHPEAAAVILVSVLAQLPVSTPLLQGNTSASLKVRLNI